MKEALNLEGLKEREITGLGCCAVCGKRLFDVHGVSFYVVEVRRAIIDVAAVQRQAGLTVSLGGNGFLASVMGPDEDFAKVVDGASKRMVHEECAHHVSLFDLLGDA